MRQLTNIRTRPGFLVRLALAGLNLLVPLHTGGLLLYYLAHALGGREHWLVDALGYVLPWLFLPSLLLIPLALFVRSRVRLVLAGVPVVLFAATYGHLYLPRAPVRVGDPTFSAMAYNVYVDNRQVEQIARSIEAFDPDFVGLRELLPDIAADLEERLADRYPYHRIDTGCGFWSRYPILQYDPALQTRDRGIQHLVLDVGGQQVTVLNVHLYTPVPQGYYTSGLPLTVLTGFDNTQRDADMRYLLERVDQVEGPLVVIGDLNITHRQSLYPDLLARLRDAHRDAGWGMGHTLTRFRGVGVPTCRIDYVLHTPDLVSLRTDVGDYGGSDHRPVYAELGFAGEQ